MGLIRKTADHADRPVKYGSLCSGIGGDALAVEEVFGAEPAWFCESNRAATKVLKKHWPHVPVLPDVRNQDWSTVESVEIVTAGYPCQPFSQAGRRLGERDERHLWPHIFDAVRVLRPRVVVLENVSMHLGLGFDAVLGDLAEAGFDAEWALVRASDVGCCHRRERLFVVATDSGSGRFGEQPGEPSPQEAGTNEGHVVAGDGSGETVADADCVGREGSVTEPQPDDSGSDHEEVAADSSGVGWEPGTGLRESGPSGFGDGRSGDVHGEVDWGVYRAAIERHERLVGRPAPVPVDDRRRLNVGFVEWLQCFEAGWVDGLTRTSALRCLGNAVVVPQMVFALKELIHTSDRMSVSGPINETDVSTVDLPTAPLVT